MSAFRAISVHGTCAAYLVTDEMIEETKGVSEETKHFSFVGCLFL